MIGNIVFWKYKIIIYFCLNSTGKLILSSASENILLMANALGLGSVWCAIYPHKGRIKAIKKALGLPLGISPFSAIYVGYPSKDDKSQVKDKYKERNVEHL